MSKAFAECKEHVSLSLYFRNRYWFLGFRLRIRILWYVTANMKLRATIFLHENLGIQLQPTILQYYKR